MASKYDSYWQGKLDAILKLFDDARLSQKSEPLDVSDLAQLGSRGSWHGRLELVDSLPVGHGAAHMTALGNVLQGNLPEWATALAWRLAVSQEFKLTVEQVDLGKINWFEAAYREGKLAETVERAAVHLGPITTSGSESFYVETQSGTDLFVVFCTIPTGWFGLHADRLAALAARQGALLFSFTDEPTSTLYLWRIPLDGLMTRIQERGLTPRLDSGRRYSLFLVPGVDQDVLEPLEWDVRPFRLASERTELTRAAFHPSPVVPPPAQANDGTDETRLKVLQRLAQWRQEASDLNHPNHYHADLEQPARSYAAISGLLAKLRNEADQFSEADVRSLFGALNAGQRMKNQVVKENPLPELRQQLLAMLDGDGPPVTRISAASTAIRYAGLNTLGELYGWAHVDTAPLYNACATEALAHLGYVFDADDYEAFVTAHEQFTKVYQEHVGHLKPDLPLNLEIDKLYNVIDKVDLKQKPPTQRFWKIAPGEGAWNWDACREGGFISASWEGFGDLTGMDRVDFEARCQTYLTEHPDGTMVDLEQLWRFYKIQEGDRVIANRGTAEILGIGTVAGPYYYVPKERHGHRVPVQWNDLTPRQVNEPGWRRTLIGLERAKFEALSQAPAIVKAEPAPTPGSPFSTRTFELLAGLHANPTKDYYLPHKEGFKEHVEEPFQRVLRRVAERLPPPIKSVMETQQNLFARFLKNDWGGGGAWDFYWGAFYPKGGKRTEDAQLSLWMNYQRLECGFYIGEYGSAQRKRFERNCQEHGSTLVADLREALPESTVHFGSHDNLEVAEDGTVQVKVQSTWEQFLHDPAAAQNDVSVIVPKRELLATPEGDLVEQISQAYEKLFPLVLLAVEDDPLPMISRYLQSIGLTGSEQQVPPPPPYDRQDFLAHTYLCPEQADDLYDLLRDKRQIILYGPPGTGKTYVAQELARWVTGLAEPPAERVEMIQFHPAYGYEDFIEGIRPESKLAGEDRYVVDYPPRPGVFRRFCESVPSNFDQKCVFIIDEINRGNIPRIFGELMLLLEYRERDVPLPYSGERFRIPPNVYLIATMNTADRSIALVDFALRRRFHFFHFGADPNLIERWLAEHPVPIPYLAALYRRLSEEAIDDPDFAVGPSYFMDPNLTEAKLERIWRYSIVPYLAEYFIEQKARLDRWRWDSDLLKGIRGEA